MIQIELYAQSASQSTLTYSMIDSYMCRSSWSVSVDRLLPEHTRSNKSRKHCLYARMLRSTNHAGSKYGGEMLQRKLRDQLKFSQTGCQVEVRSCSYCHLLWRM